MKGFGQNAGIHLDANKKFGGLAQNFVNLADFALVVQIDSRIEIRNLLIQRPATDQFVFAIVQDLSGFCKFNDAIQSFDMR